VTVASLSSGNRTFEQPGGRESEPDAADWRAYLDDDGQAVTFCPECAEREFGGA
jgi:hypothetical protein